MANNNNVANLKSYVMWNNKGGVGKSTLTFQLSCLYAQDHPDERVVVVDLCPQANSSMMLLGGGVNGQAVVQQFYNQNNPSQSAFGYLQAVLANIVQSQNTVVPLAQFLTQVSAHNENIPKNLYLVVGDQKLNDIATPLTQQANSAGMQWNQAQQWTQVHSSLRLSLEALTNKTTVFIDTNPSFAIYTAIGICAADQIIAPIKPDDSSRIGLQSMMDLIFGPSPVALSFANQAQHIGIQLPRIRLVIGNQLAQYQTSAKAYKAMFEEAVDTLWMYYQQNPGRFAATQALIQDKEEFNDFFSVEVRDFNTCGVVSAHLGKPLYILENDKRQQQVAHLAVKLTPEQIQQARQQLDDIVAEL